MAVYPVDPLTSRGCPAGTTCSSALLNSILGRTLSFNCAHLRVADQMRIVAAFGILLLGGCSVDTAPLEYKPLAQDVDWEPPERSPTPIEPLLAPRVVQTEVVRAPVEQAPPPLPDLPPPPPAAVEREPNPCAPGRRENFRWHGALHWRCRY
jgi:hypothetical protein